MGRGRGEGGGGRGKGEGRGSLKCKKKVHIAPEREPSRAGWYLKSLADPTQTQKIHVTPLFCITLPGLYTRPAPT